VDKAGMAHLYNRILLGPKKEDNFTLLIAWMNLENIMLSTIGFYSSVGFKEQSQLTSKIETYSE
jgi:hypothetical protein